MNTKLYRVMVSIIVEAYDDEDARKEAMQAIYDDTMVIEAVSEIPTPWKEPNHGQDH